MENLIHVAVCIGAMSFVLSFFGFLEPFKFLLHEPGIRQIHQAMRYYHTAERPPNLIYVTDGGVQDCTGILQLMRRRCPRILLVLAAEDPEDELTVLKTTMGIVAENKLGSFFDPKDPRRDVRITVEEYSKDKSIPFLHLGIRYGWYNDGPHLQGHLVIVKNRLPPSMIEEPTRPLLTEEEILRCEPSQEVWPGGMHQADLGACCCDCCHVNSLDCGTRFPHVPNVNQCLTPQMFNSLCRLGFEVSAAAVEAISHPEMLSGGWESCLPGLDDEAAARTPK